MAMLECRFRILRVLYEMGARDVDTALDCEEFVRRLGNTWDKIRQEVAYLREKKCIELYEPQYGPRVYRSIYLTADGIDLAEGGLIETPDSRERQSIPFKLQLSMRDSASFEVRALETDFGEPHLSSELPYRDEELTVILKALGLPKYDPDSFSPEQRQLLDSLKLLQHGQFIQGLHGRIGEILFKVLIEGKEEKDMYAAFKGALNLARKTDGSVALQLRFDEDAVELARYPWELLYDDRPLLPSGEVELTRYITYSEGARSLPMSPPLQLLYIRSRPTDETALPNELEQNAVQQAVDPLVEKGHLTMHVMPQPTWDTVLDHLEEHDVHVLHFDGHGVFARRCPECEKMNYPRASSCAFRSCGQDISHIRPYGFLAFEDGTRHVDWISQEQLAALLHKRSLRLVVLSACWSSAIGGETLFAGVAPALIQSGIPAVVATQLPITVDAASKFFKGFYRALARFEPLPAAVNDGRLRIRKEHERFIPTLYLRSRDDHGELFCLTEKENP